MNFIFKMFFFTHLTEIHPAHLPQSISWQRDSLTYINCGPSRCTSQVYGSQDPEVSPAAPFLAWTVPCQPHVCPVLQPTVLQGRETAQHLTTSHPESRNLRINREDNMLECRCAKYLIEELVLLQARQPSQLVRGHLFQQWKHTRFKLLQGH